MAKNAPRSKKPASLQKPKQDPNKQPSYWKQWLSAGVILTVITFAMTKGCEYRKEQQELVKKKPVLELLNIGTGQTPEDVVYEVVFRNTGERAVDHMHVAFTFFFPTRVIRFRGMPANRTVRLKAGDSSMYRDFICKPAMSQQELYNAFVVFKFRYRDVHTGNMDSSYSYAHHFLDGSNIVRFRGLDDVQYQRIKERYENSLNLPFFSAHTYPDLNNFDPYTTPTL